MNEKDIRNYVMAAKQAAMASDEKLFADHAFVLVAQVLVDLNRIASALEVLAKPRGNGL